MKQHRSPVDIIIPVYNGYEDLQRCIPSVKNYTDLGFHRLVLINDCSPDERIAPYLDSLSDDHILVLHNEKNLGFSGNVNRGMQLAKDRDVLLLNSDTVVTKGWLEKIIACAYRDESIGTVTPLSNSATLCSVPVMCQDNPVPEHLTIDEYAALIERCSLHRYPRITVAVGFCMFIKRRLIEDIGFFDAATFGRGYGEENDFCNRAEQAGYCHVMCDDTFVYHKGTASFDTDEKKKLLEEHESILNSRYAQQMRRNHLYCMENPDQEIRDNIILHTKLQNGKKNLLYLLHLDFREEASKSIGGTQLHVKELMENFRGEYNIFVAARDEADLCVTAYTETESVTLRFRIGKAPQFPVFRDTQLRRIYEQILAVFEIDLVHIHHTQDLSLELYEAARELDIPVAATMHDYFAACPTILLLDKNDAFCAGQDGALTQQEQQERCRACLEKKLGLYAKTDYLKIWRREYGRALRTCRKLVFPSESAREILLQYYPELEEKSITIEHGEDSRKNRPLRIQPLGHVQKHPRLKIKLDRVPGTGQGLNDVKGWAYLPGVPSKETEIYVELTDAQGKKECFPAQKTARQDIVDAFGDPGALMSGFDLRIFTDQIADGPVKIAVYVRHGSHVWTDGHTVRGEYRRSFGEKGRLHVAFLGGMVKQKGSRMARELIRMDRSRIDWFVFGAIGDPEMLELKQENCFFSSTYRTEELPQLLGDNEIDLVCILPIWPETFCYTVSEAWMNGIPVVGTDIGAVGERIRRTGGGWLVQPDDPPGKVLELLHHIQEHPEEYREKKAAVERMEKKSVAEMCASYRKLYAELLSEDTKRTDRVCPDYDFIFQGLACGNQSVGGRGAAAAVNRLQNENEALKSYIQVLQGTSSYRLARKIAEANVPFKEPLKRVVRRLRGQA